MNDECPVRGHSGWVLSVAYSPDGKHIVTGSNDNTVKVWDSQTGKEVSVLLCHHPIVCCCVDCADLRVWSMSRSAR
jgi:WD40 repeat protein